MSARLDSHPVFDPAILRGFHLLESDAGTGKTWTITGLVVRALIERRLDIDQVLVVTFTNAATAELAARIRERIAMMVVLLEDRIADREPRTDELFCTEYLGRIADPGAALASLRVALSRIDEAAVRTIHGFCQRVIDEYGLTIGLPQRLEVGEGDIGWIDELVADWWRRHAVPASADQLALLADSGATPERLTQLVRAIHANPGARRTTPAGDWRELATGLAALRTRLADVLAEESGALLDWIGIKGNVNGKQVRSDWARGWLARLSHWCASGNTGTGMARLARDKLAEDAFRLSSERFEQALSGRAMPAFRVPALCSELARHLARCGTVAAQLAETIWRDTEAQRLERRRGAARLGFDELLLIVHEALADPDCGAELARALREQYPLALIDECQDTDALQWAIFRRIYLARSDRGCEGEGEGEGFDRCQGGAPAGAAGSRGAAAGNSGLILVGDPKQAIYAFRGADVYSYLEARAGSPRLHALHENQRSVPGLIDAVNALFSAGRPFDVTGIEFTAARAGTRRRRVLHGEGRADGRAPLTVMCFEGGAGGEPMTIEQATGRAVAATVAEIDYLLRAGLRLDDQPLEPADIAVLVDSHVQGSRIKQALGMLGIGAAEISRDSVIASPEGAQLLRWLAAVADPADAGLIRSALLAVPGGFDAASLDALADDAPRWAAWVEHFAACRETWARLGAQAALRRLLFATGAAGRLAALRDGERRLTNLLHLFELLAASDEAARGPRQGWRWLARARAGGAPARDAVELRLDSDENLIRILTVHKSKGLEFPFVFLPFAWQGKKPKSEPPIVHHIGPESRSGRAAHWQAVLELSDAPDPGVCEQAVFEKQAESVRRLYVALTRAEQRCYVVWGPASAASDSALGRLLQALEKAGAPFRGIAVWQELAPAESMALLGADATPPRPAAANPGASAAVARLITGSIVESCAGCPPPPRARTFTGAIRQPWIRTSFSALHARLSDERTGSDEADERPDHDQLDRPAIASGNDASGNDAAGNDAAGSARTLDVVVGSIAASDQIRFAFPAGARAGACLHAILEQCALDQPVAPSLVAQQLERAGFHNTDRLAVSRWLDEVLDTPLHAPDGRAVSLRALSPQSCVREMDFLLAASGVDDQALLQALATEYPVEPGIARWHWDGFLRGFIDLVFEHEGRWYVLDWKSNRLGERFDAYSHFAIEASMRTHTYSLQACLYLLALHRFLRLRLPNYDWDRDIGGAFWVFLRGVRPAPAAGLKVTHGVHASKPSRELIERLDRLLGGAGSQAQAGRLADGRLSHGIRR